MGIGLGIGLPAGFLYHYRLYQALERNGTVPAGWWLSPSDFHDALPAAHFARIKPWYVLGGLSFALALAGGLSTFAGLLMLR